jgi:hypothetical protein
VITGPALIAAIERLSGERYELAAALLECLAELEERPCVPSPSARGMAVEARARALIARIEGSAAESKR